MKLYFLIIFIVFAFVQTNAQCSKIKKDKAGKAIMSSKEVKFENLPDNAKLSDEVRVNKYNDDGVIISFETITVKEKLKQIGAKYVDGKLVDKEGTIIRFYKPPVRGASQGFEEDRRQAEIDAKELAELKEKFTVIEIYINPLKIM